MKNLFVTEITILYGVTFEINSEICNYQCLKTATSPKVVSV